MNKMTTNLACESIINQSVFDELIMTAAIELTPCEREYLRSELDKKMAVIRQLDAIPLDRSTSPVIHGNPYPAEIRCGLREDVWVPFENSAELIQQAPSSTENYIISPDVPHQRIG